MSQERSSSAVRNLRSLFEKQGSEDTPVARGRSPGGLAIDADTPRPRSRVRASFYAVESPKLKPTAINMATAPDFSNVPNTLDPAPLQNRDASTGRRPSFSESKNSTAIEAGKDTVTTEATQRKSAGADAVPENAIATPLVEVDKQLGKKSAAGDKKLDKSSAAGDKKSGKPAHHIGESAEKPVTGLGEEPTQSTSVAPTSADAMAGAQALPSGKEDAKKHGAPASKPAEKSNTATMVTTAQKPASSTKPVPRPPTSHARSPGAATARSASSAPQRQPTEKTSRSSLKASTTASAARGSAADKAPPTAPKPSSSVPKPKPKEPTKPADLPSRLTAPTAASRAKHESASEPTPTSHTSTRVKPAATTSTTRSQRPSLGRPESRSSQVSSSRKSAVHVDGSFLERMTRPTAASANRLHDRTDVKEASKTHKLPSRPKVNGHPKDSKGTKISKGAHSNSLEPACEPTALEDASVWQDGEHIDEPIQEAQDAADEHKPDSAVDTTEGNNASSHNTNGHKEDSSALEGTPAALSAGDSIR